VATTSVPTAASKDPVRESHARDLVSMPVHPTILDEEFSKYHALLDTIEVESTTITRPCLPTMGPIPVASGKINARVSPSTKR